MAECPLQGPFRVETHETIEQDRVIDAEDFIIADCASTASAQWICDALNAAWNTRAHPTESAEDVARRIAHELSVRVDVAPAEINWEAVQERIASALTAAEQRAAVAERERCAVIAEDARKGLWLKVGEDNLPLGSAMMGEDAAQEATALTIASAIRGQS